MRAPFARFFLVLVGLFVLSVLSVFLYAFITRASVYNLYTTSCLGGWENTHLAYGPPDAFQPDGTLVFTEANSARLFGDAHAQIFCGGFSGDILEDTIPKKILVKFSWAAIYPKSVTNTTSSGSTSSAGPEKESVVKDEEKEIEGKESEQITDDTVLQEEKALESEERTAEESEEPSEESVPPAEESPEPVSEPEPTPPPPPESPAEPEEPEPISFFRFLNTIAYAQEQESEEQGTSVEEIEEEENEDGSAVIEIEEIDEITDTDTDFASTTATTTPSLQGLPYGLVEVLYTLDGVEWKSLGFVEKDEFSSKYFEIPIEEASEWEDISRIQIGIQSVPVVDAVVPVIYLDSLWLEAEYIYVEEPEEPQDFPEPDPPSGGSDSFFDEEEDPGDEEIIGEEEDDDIEEEEEIQEPLPPPLSVRKFNKNVVIDPSAPHQCEARPFKVDISDITATSTQIILEKETSGIYEAEIGSLPDGIVVRFSKNDDFVYQPGKRETVLDLSIINEEGSRKGDFNILTVFTKKGQKDSSVVCQINIINE